jgi:tetratricopeptide (TPR) repeat protein
LLALAAFQSARAADITIETSGDAATLVVMASDAGDVVQPPSALKGTELVIRDENAGQPAADAAVAESEAGTLSVVANAQRNDPVAAIMVDPNVAPAAASERRAPANGPRRPAAAAGIQSRQHSHRGPSAPSNAMPRAAASTHAEPKPTGKVAGSLSPAHELLVRAYQLSLTASTEAEYSQIVRWCAEGMRQGLDGENRKFALDLSAWALNRRGQMRADQGQREIAIADFNAALGFDAKCWRALHNRGVTYAQSGQFAEAFDDITKVIQLNPHFAKAYSNRATLYVQAGDYERALADYDSALKLDPALMPALVGRGRVCHMAGQLEEALASFNTAIEQDNSNADIVCSRGDLLVDLGRYSEALEDYARAIDLNPEFQHAYRNGAWLLATCPDDSIRDAEAAINGAQAALDCGYGERHAALDTLAAALANAGRFEEAVATVEQAIEIAPQNAAPAYQERRKLYELGQPFRTQPVGEDVQAVEFVEG